MDVLDFFQDFVRRITFSVPTYHSPITLCRPVPMGPTEWYPLSLHRTLPPIIPRGYSGYISNIP